MHNEEAALVRAIYDSPHDDTVRLAYADWLDEHAGTVKRCEGKHSHEGKPGFNHGVWHDTDPKRPHHHCDEKCVVSDGRRERAELIRVQCELARLPIERRDNGMEVYPDEDVERRVIACRVAETRLLAPASIQDWFDVPGWHRKWKGLPENGPRGTITWFPDWDVSQIRHADRNPTRLIGIEGFVRRGFVDFVRIHPTLWYRCWRELLRHQPITRVSLSSPPPMNAEFVPSVNRFRFSLRDFAGDEFEMDESVVMACADRSEIIQHAAKGVLERTWPGIEFNVPRQHWTEAAPVNWEQLRTSLLGAGHQIQAATTAIAQSLAPAAQAIANTFRGVTDNIVRQIGQANGLPPNLTGVTYQPGAPSTGAAGSDEEG